LAVLAGLGVAGCSSSRSPERAVAPAYHTQAPPTVIYKTVYVSAPPSAQAAAAPQVEVPPLLARPEDTQVEAPTTMPAGPQVAQAGQPTTLTSSCGSSTWLANATNQPPPPPQAVQGERG
jgi:hypothetical protein